MPTKRMLVIALALALSAPVLAQDQTVQIANPNDTPPLYRVTVVERTTKAIDFRKGHDEKLDLIGTSLMPEARGNAKVEPHTGRVKIDVDFKNMKPAQTFGPEYLTYVLWAITPEGRPQNLGEVVLKDKDDKDSDLHVTTNLQSFGMIVTAEPYFGVSYPSDLVVMENQIPSDLKADIRPIDTRYQAVNRTEYGVNIQRSDLPATSADKDVPLELLEARNAIVIAKAADAKDYAEASLTKAESALTNAENAYRRDKESSEVVTAARLAVQTAEDARLMAIRKKQEEKVAQERAAAQQREQEAQQKAQQAQLDAQRQEEQRRQAELDKQSADRARQEAELAAQRAADERRQAEEARQQALAQQQQLAQQAQQSQLQAQQAEQARQQADQARQEAERQVQETRQRLQAQLNSVLQTRESARGLIVNMSDVLFDLNKATLKPGARVKLAKVAGIVTAYPDLKLQVEGFTDSTGTEEYNQRLSEQRAQAVREFLTSQGVPAANISSQGYGESDPIASNDNATGRQLNRRVELVVSGESIGQATTAHAPGSESTAPVAQQPSAVASPTAQPTTPQQ
jgi:outer membrane protein OmpA-like peptidoglycan-associated protein